MARKAAKEALGQAGQCSDMPETTEFSLCLFHLISMENRMCHPPSCQTGITAQDVDVVELHDCFSTNELITYEALVNTIQLITCVLCI